MAVASYQQFCPVAMAAEILCTRWTIVLLREMFAGSTRFNELRRGVPRMSPALLSRRLKELEDAGIVARAPSAESGVSEYHLTEAGRELKPLVDAFGIWGQRRIESDLSLQHLDADLLMWDMRRSLNISPMPKQPQHHRVHLSAPAGGAAALLAGGRPEGGRRSLQDRSRLRGRSLRLRRSALDDRDLDGARHRARRGGKPAHGPHGEQAARLLDADLARAQPVRQGAQARELA